MALPGWRGSRAGGLEGAQPLHQPPPLLWGRVYYFCQPPLRDPHDEEAAVRPAVWVDGSFQLGSSRRRLAGGSGLAASILFILSPYLVSAAPRGRRC